MTGPLPTFYRWTIRFEGGHYTVDAPSAADAMTMYRVNVVDQQRFRHAGLRLQSPLQLTVTKPPVTPPELGLWIDGKEYQGVGTESP